MNVRTQSAIDYLNKSNSNILNHMLKLLLIMFVLVTIISSHHQLGYVSLSLSPHTIAYYSVLVSMKFYYGDCQGYAIVPERSIPERETDLCLCLIGSLYKFLHPICLSIANNQNPQFLEETVQLSSSTYPSSTPEHENVPP